MKNLITSILILILIVLINSCTETETDTETLISKKSVGIVRDANLIPTSFNEGIKTQVKCDSLFVIIYGAPILKLGSEAFIYTYNDENKYFVCGDYIYKIRKYPTLWQNLH